MHICKSFIFHYVYILFYSQQVPVRNLRTVCLCPIILILYDHLALSVITSCWYQQITLRLAICCIEDSGCTKKKDKRKSRECHNHKPQPFPDPKRKRKRTNPNKHKPNKRTKSTKISSLFPSEVIAILNGPKNTRTK